MNEIPSASKLLKAVGVGAAVAVTLLVTVVLPAEYGLDPLGTGRALGLVALADAGRGAITPQPADYNVDSVSFELGPYQWIEYKYHLQHGGGLLYAWKASGPVNYDFHSEPADAAPGYAESFDEGHETEGFGTYLAPFSGIHGWFFENPSAGVVTIELRTAGFYDAASLFRDGSVETRPFP